MAATSGQAAVVAPAAPSDDSPVLEGSEALAAYLAEAGAEGGGGFDALEMARLAVAMQNAPGGQMARLQNQQMLNLDAARDILAIEAGTHASRLARQLAVAEAASQWQHRTLSVGATVDGVIPESSAPSTALAELALRYGVQPTPEQAADLARLDEGPTDVAEALTRFSDAFLALDAAADDAYASVASTTSRSGWSLGTEVEPSSPFTSGGVDLSRVISARERFLGTVANLEDALDDHRKSEDTSCEPVHVPPVFTIELAGCDTIYTEDVVLLLDVGGDDKYHNNAGGNGVGGTCLSPSRVAALLDFAGNDTYGDPTAPRRCGANGGGYIGLGILVDGGGDDRYSGGDYGTNGGGNYAGIGLLVDTGGTDVFQGGSHGVNGGGSQGAGMLLAGPGDSRYLADTSGVNGGAGIGAGFLYDAGGRDEYQATCCGANGGAYMGAAGFLLDLGGDDIFRAPALIVGGVILFLPLGAVNGGATIAGAGFLLSMAGNDRYIGRHAGANGGGYIGGFGMLLDGDGNDTYTADDRGTNGGGHLGTGILIDVAGNDLYRATSDGANGGATTGSGLLLDTGGTDRYEDSKVPGGACDDCSVPAKGLLGNQLDVGNELGQAEV